MTEKADLRKEVVGAIEAAAPRLSRPSARSRVINLVERELRSEGSPAARVAKATEALKSFRQTIRVVG